MTDFFEAKTTISILLILALLVALVFLVAGAVLVGADPNTVNVKPEDAFIYPDGDAFVLVLPYGAYQVRDTDAGGCYRLIPPARGAAYGRASRVWPYCLKVFETKGVDDGQTVKRR